MPGDHERRIECARKPQGQHDGGGVTGQKHSNGLQFATSERKPQSRVARAFAQPRTAREMLRTPSCVANVWMLCWRSPSTSGRSCKLGVSEGAGRVTQQALRRTLVMAMTVANMVTKQVMNVIAGLHCKSQVQVTMSFLIGAVSRLAPQTEAAVPSESPGRRRS